MPLPIRLIEREAHARLEVGRTTISRRTAWAMVLFFLAVIVLVPLVRCVRDVRAYVAGQRDSAWPQAFDIFRSPPRAITAAWQAEGSLVQRMLVVNRILLGDIGVYQATLKDESIFVGAMTPPVQEAMTGLLGGGTERVYVGRDGWLFYRPDLDYVMGHPFLEPTQLARRASQVKDGALPQSDPRPAILDFHRQLASRGIRLIVMPTPAKPTIHPEQFSPECRPGGPPLENASFREFKEGLEREGVLVFDPAETLKDYAANGPVYLAADTHWRPEAMEHAAEGLQRFIEKHVRLPEAPPVAYQRETQEVTNTGDLAVALRLPAGQTLFPPETVQTQQILTPQGGLWRATREADVLILGDSFSNMYSLDGMGWGDTAGLVEQVSCLLQRPVDAILRNGSGAYATREILDRELARGMDRLAGKRVVVWQFATRELASGDWKRIDVQLRQAPPARFFVPPDGKTITVTGTVEAVSFVPRPRTVPYRNHILALHLADVEAGKEGIADEQAVVYMWSMRDNVWTAAAHYRPGDCVTLTVRPWADVAAEYERFNRSELRNEALQLEEPCWGETEKP